MSQLFTGSICLSDLMQKAKECHSAFSRAQNGKVYVNILQWLNDEPDKFGNTISIQLNSTKEKKELEGKFYIGNAKKVESAAPAPVTQEEAEKEFEDDLPF